MPRKRQRMRRDPHTFQDGMNQGHHVPPDAIIDGQAVKVRRIHPNDEGVLYTMDISHRKPLNDKEKKSASSFLPPSLRGKFRTASDINHGPKSDTLWGAPSLNVEAHPTQFTIAKKKKFNNRILNWIDSHNLNLWNSFNFSRDVDSHLYRPSNFLYRFIDWTFQSGFTAVFLSFLIIYFGAVIFFGGLLYAAGNAQPECIMSAGAHFGSNPLTKFYDAFHLSWTTFTTVGYGNGYTSTANDLVAADGSTKHAECSMVVFLCNSAAFSGLLYAGMCGAILFGKVNRVQSHAKLLFANAVCLQYEEIDPDDDDLEEATQGKDLNGNDCLTPVTSGDPIADDRDEENPSEERSRKEQFVDQYDGCPVIKFQVVNEMCNREGTEIVDAIMKVVGIKFKGQGEKVTHAQYVRVVLVDFEHPFFSRIWHGVHILNSSSPLLTEKAKRTIRENNGSWPTEWFNPEMIKQQLEFNDLVVTVAGISNVSAVTVHAYKRYKIGDVLIGFNFAPVVFRDEDSGKIEVDMTLCHDVREQRGGGCEDLINHSNRSLKRRQSNIRISRIRQNSVFGSMASGSELRVSTQSSRAVGETKTL